MGAWSGVARAPQLCSGIGNHIGDFLLVQRYFHMRKHCSSYFSSIFSSAVSRACSSPEITRSPLAAAAAAPAPR